MDRAGRSARWIRHASTWTVVVVAVSAAVLSFSGLRQIALESGFPAPLAWLLPVVIDGMVVMGSLGVIVSELVGLPRWFPWLLVTFGVAASVAGNVAAAPPTLMARLVHAFPPIAFALSVEGLLRVYRALVHSELTHAALTTVETPAPPVAVEPPAASPTTSPAAATDPESPVSLSAAPEPAVTAEPTAAPVDLPVEPDWSALDEDLLDVATEPEAQLAPARQPAAKPATRRTARTAPRPVAPTADPGLDAVVDAVAAEQIRSLAADLDHADVETIALATGHDLDVVRRVLAA